MADLTWTQLGSHTLSDKDIHAPWMCVDINIPTTATHLKLVASGKWIALPGVGECSPDGHAGRSAPDDQLLLTDCPVGALIGRIGGSSATLKVADADAAAGATKPFAVGSCAVLKLPVGFVGPLFLGLNVLRRPIRIGALNVDVYSGV